MDLFVHECLRFCASGVIAVQFLMPLLLFLIAGLICIRLAVLFQLVQLCYLTLLHLQWPMQA